MQTKSKSPKASEKNYGLEFEFRPMLHAGMTCKPSPEIGLSAKKINHQSNAAGIFKPIKSLKDVAQHGWDAVDNIIRKFPKN